MPEHVHLLVNEPERGCLARLLQSLKQSVARTLALRAAESFFTGTDGVVEIESQWTAQRREKLGIMLTTRVRENPAQAKLERGTLKSRLEV